MLPLFEKVRDATTRSVPGCLAIRDGPNRLVAYTAPGVDPDGKPESMLQNGEHPGLPLTPPERAPIPANLLSFLP